MAEADGAEEGLAAVDHGRLDDDLQLVRAGTEKLGDVVDVLYHHVLGAAHVLAVEPDVSDGVYAAEEKLVMAAGLKGGDVEILRVAPLVALPLACEVVVVANPGVGFQSGSHQVDVHIAGDGRGYALRSGRDAGRICHGLFGLHPEGKRPVGTVEVDGLRQGRDGKQGAYQQGCDFSHIVNIVNCAY